MKAWVLHGINDFRYEEREVPALSDNEVLIRVKAAGVCGSDIARVFESGAHRMPLIIGHEFSGEVVQVGKSVDKKWNGKRAGVFPLIPCRDCSSCHELNYEMCRQYSYLGSRQNGGFADYAVVPEWNLMELPDTVTYEEAAMMEPMAVAVHAMRRVKLSQEDQVVVYGLGTIGQLLVMFLLEKGIKNLLVIGNKEFQKQSVVKVGVSECDYCDSKIQNVEDWILTKTKGHGADVVFECVGKNETIVKTICLAALGGKICLVGNPYSDVLLDKKIYWEILRHQLTIAGTWNSSYTGNEDDDWHYVSRRLEQKRIAPADLISHRYSMQELDKGFEMIRSKSEEFIKIMMLQE